MPHNKDDIETYAYAKSASKYGQRAFTVQLCAPLAVSKRIHKCQADINSGIKMAQSIADSLHMGNWCELQDVLRYRYPNVPSKMWRHARDWCASNTRHTKCPVIFDTQSFDLICIDGAHEVAFWRQRIPIVCRDASRHIEQIAIIRQMRTWWSYHKRKCFATFIYDPQLVAMPRQDKTIAMGVGDDGIALSNGMVTRTSIVALEDVMRVANRAVQLALADGVSKIVVAATHWPMESAVRSSVQLALIRRIGELCSASQIEFQIIAVVFAEYETLINGSGCGHGMQHKLPVELVAAITLKSYLNM